MSSPGSLEVNIARLKAMYHPTRQSALPADLNSQASSFSSGSGPPTPVTEDSDNERQIKVEKTESPLGEAVADISSITNQLQRQLGPATDGKFYHEDERLPSIYFIYCPDPSRYPLGQDWAAVLQVKCSDVPLLMREGFDWSDANVVKEEGYLGPNTPIFQRCRHDGRRWVNIRNYFLKDLQQPSRWVATIEVAALDLSILARFDLDQLTKEKLWSACATSESRHRIYNYRHAFPGRCYNIIYDDMPLQGRWPWPGKN